MGKCQNYVGTICAGVSLTRNSEGDASLCPRVIYAWSAVLGMAAIVCQYNS